MALTLGPALDIVHNEEKGQNDGSYEFRLTHSAVMLPLNMIAGVFVQQMVELGLPFIPQWLNATVRAEQPHEINGVRHRTVRVKGLLFFPYAGVEQILDSNCHLIFANGSWIPESVEVTYEDSGKVITERHACENTDTHLWNIKKQD